jgi:hypothetical protein
MSVSDTSCAHDVVFKGLCAICGKTVATAVSNNYSYNGHNNSNQSEQFIVEHPGLLGTTATTL